MKRSIASLAIAATAFLATAEDSLATSPEDGARKAHKAYLAAINSNDLDRFLVTVTDDIVFIAPNSPVIEGKAQVAPWVGGYFEAVETA